MTGEHRVATEQWDRLEDLWERVRGLSPDQRTAFLDSEAVDAGLREELESLLGHANAAEAFFERLQTVVSDTDPFVGTTVAHYEIAERLGEGGMGVVYRAVDLRLRRPVALKLLRGLSSHDPSARERMLAEARAAAALDHPNICTIYEVGETAERLPFIAMAFYPGKTLEQILHRGRLAVSTAVDYARQIASGLRAAHQRGIIHRDVKPANIIVTTDGVVKLLDFGIARMRDAGTSQETMTPGTVAYMSPEQVASRALDHRTDLWSLGVVLHEMCTGERPFAGANAGEIAHAILHESPRPPSLVPYTAFGVGRVEPIIARLLAKDAVRRHDDAEQLVADLTTVSGARRRRLRRRASYAAAGLALLSMTSSWSGTTAPAVSERRIAAQDAYAQGNRDVLFRSESGRRQAAQFFRQAVALDSAYATAHAGLAHLLVLSSEDAGGSRRERLFEADKAARTAIRLDSLLADAHAAMGHVLLYHYHLANAEREFKRAVALDPKTPYVREFLVWLYIFMERRRDALREAERAVVENPDSPTAIAEHARALAVNRRCEEAMPLLRRLAYLQPPPARVASIAAQCHARQQLWQRAIDELRPVAERNPLLVYPLLGFMFARAGHTDRALQIRDTLFALWRQGTSGAYGLAVIDAGLRDFDGAFKWLDRSIDDRSLRYNIMEPVFEELHRDARFVAVRRRLGIHEPTR